MLDDESLLVGAAQYISESPLIYRKYIQRSLDEDDPSKLQDIGYQLTGEKPVTGHLIGLGVPIVKNSLWEKVLAEVFDLFCTESDAYKEERSKGAGTFQSLVAVVSSSLGATMNVGVGILSGLVAIALILVAKMGRNAWCSQQRERMGTAG